VPLFDVIFSNSEYQVGLLGLLPTNCNTVYNTYLWWRHLWTQTWIFAQNLWTDADSKFQYQFQYFLTPKFWYPHISDAYGMDEV